MSRLAVYEFSWKSANFQILIETKIFTHTRTLLNRCLRGVAK